MKGNVGASFAAVTVAPFRVVVDSNEAAHGTDYTFSNLPVRSECQSAALVVPRVVRHLETGDYSIDGWEDRICVERKTLEDLYGTLGKGRERFEREFERMRAMPFAAVVVEASWQEICRPQQFRPGWRSELHPRSVWGTVFAWSQRYQHIHWFTMGSRRLAEMATYEILERFWRDE
jgi:ERCC4-type nuclease